MKQYKISYQQWTEFIIRNFIISISNKLDITTMTPEQLENVIEQIKGMQNDFKELDCKLEERAMKDLYHENY